MPQDSFLFSETYRENIGFGADGEVDDERLAGRLYWPREKADLLTRPREGLATILAFSAGDPVDLGLYAYAPGHTRELRLTGVMNAIVNA